jgi:hypothetical protein
MAAQLRVVRSAVSAVDTQLSAAKFASILLMRLSSSICSFCTFSR